MRGRPRSFTLGVVMRNLAMEGVSYLRAWTHQLGQDTFSTTLPPRRIREAELEDLATSTNCQASAVCGRCMALNYEEHGE
jgi:hypothetical protein